MKRRAKKVDEEPPGAPEWVVTFTDMISLLVTFFVLLMTFSSMEEFDLLRVKGVLQGSSGALSHKDANRTVSPPEEDLISSTDPLRGSEEAPEAPIESWKDEVTHGPAPSPERTRVPMERAADGLIVRWGPDASFAPGSAELNDALRRGLGELADILGRYPHRVVLEGHTDDNFRATPRYPDESSLALARATAAADYLITRHRLEPTRLQLASHGSTRPLRPENTPQARRDNRRVEARILALDPSRAAELSEQWRRERLDGQR